MTRLLGVIGIFGLFVASAMSCHQRARTSSAAIAPDSLLGVVSIIGTSFEQQLVLRSGNTTTYLSAVTADSAALSRLGGVEILVVGKWASKMFRVERFSAVSVNGSPVADGVLQNEGGRLVLETAHGRIPLGNPPTALRGMVAARIWIAGPFDTGPNSYGLIAPPP